MLLIKHGGLKEEAFIEDINLAYKLEDGIKIHIPTKQENENERNQKTTEENKSNASEITSDKEMKVDTQTTKNSKVNINTATQTQLETLAGIGPSTANKIISYRKENGKFHKIEDIKEVNGIGEAKFEKIKDFICVK